MDAQASASPASRAQAAPAVSGTSSSGQPAFCPEPSTSPLRKALLCRGRALPGRRGLQPLQAFMRLPAEGCWRSEGQRGVGFLSL